MDAIDVRVLLDTHTVIWAIGDDPRLGKAAREILVRDAEDLAVSDITLLEVAMLAAKGRIECGVGVDAMLEMIASKVKVLTIDARIAAEAMALSLPQGDPFDRIIVATARRHRIPLVTCDRAVSESGLVEVIW